LRLHGCRQIGDGPRGHPCEKRRSHLDHWRCRSVMRDRKSLLLVLTFDNQAKFEIAATAGAKKAVEGITRAGRRSPAQISPVGGDCEQTNCPVRSRRGRQCRVVDRELRRSNRQRPRHHRPDRLSSATGSSILAGRQSSVRRNRPSHSCSWRRRPERAALPNTGHRKQDTSPRWRAPRSIVFPKHMLAG
jgi:hypothetical protein